MKEFDKNHDGYISREEAPPFLREKFDRLDMNKDGKLSREELERGAVVAGPRRPSDLVFALIEMSDCDDNCTGELQRVYGALRKLDTNKDGKIDPAELQAARQQLIDERVNELFTDLDTNKDGKISRDEARGQIFVDFDQIDTNKDGFIDRNELARAASAKPPRPPAAGAASPNPSPVRQPSQPEKGGR
jgi:Ca2+-binding EF-hand superfamily protein